MGQNIPGNSSSPPRALGADLFGYLEERLAGTEDIRSSGAVDYVVLGVYKLSLRILGHWRKASLRFILVRFSAGVIITTGGLSRW